AGLGPSFHRHARSAEITNREEYRRRKYEKKTAQMHEYPVRNVSCHASDRPRSRMPEHQSINAYRHRGQCRTTVDGSREGTQSGGHRRQGICEAQKSSRQEKRLNGPKIESKT